MKRTAHASSLSHRLCSAPRPDRADGTSLGRRDSDFWSRIEDRGDIPSPADTPAASIDIPQQAAMGLP